jgi:predicted ATP-dependent endonuclease of OLD family
MGIKSIKIKNLLSFEHVSINEIKDINCIIGQNNAGKSNLLKLISYFYSKLENKKVTPPDFHNDYDNFGSISIIFDTTRIKQIVTSEQKNSPYQKHIYAKLFSNEPTGSAKAFSRLFSKKKIEAISSYELTLKVNRNESIEWSVKDKEIRNVINSLFPFFEIDTRHIDLYDWDKLWHLISRLKSFNVKKLQQKDMINFIDSNISENSKSYSDFVEKIQSITKTTDYSYQEKVLNYVKVGLAGHTFNVEGETLSMQSDGTNSHKYLELFLNLLISLTRREYITPTVFIDEPEIGLHPKRNEELIYKLYDVYSSFKKTEDKRQIGKYKTPYPKILFSTHSPNILKYIVRLFENDQQIIHFSKLNEDSTKISVMNSHYDDPRFLNIFSDNEARLFFSHFILFVEGETEIEIFGNVKLARNFPILRKVDVYRTNDVVLKYVNPSYSNLSIPYLVLYDADMLLKVNVVTEKLYFTNRKINLLVKARKLGRSIYGTKQYYQKKDIIEELKHDKKVQELCGKKLDYTHFKYENFINRINKNILVTENTKLTLTTIEGCLINIKSIDVFFRWLFHEILENVNVEESKGARKKIASFMGQYASGKDASQIFNNLLSSNTRQGNLSEIESKFVKIIKLKHLVSIRKSINNHCSSEKEIVILFRLIFDGKTDTLVSIENKASKDLDVNFVKLVNDIKTIHAKKINYLFGKTSGWVTRFLNFSIDYIEIKHSESSNKNKLFEQEFKMMFPEVHDIIIFASDSID